MIQQTGNDLLESLIEAKQKLQESADSFNSQDLVQGGNMNLASIINTSFQELELAADDLGIFDALDSMVQGAVAIPSKINDVAGIKLGVNTDDEVVLEEGEVEEKSRKELEKDVIKEQQVKEEEVIVKEDINNIVE